MKARRIKRGASENGRIRKLNGSLFFFFHFLIVSFMDYFIVEILRIFKMSICITHLQWRIQYLMLSNNSDIILNIFLVVVLTRKKNNKTK